MNTKALVNWFETLVADHAEVVKLDFAALIDRAIQEKGMTRKEVAARMKTSPAWVTKVLRGDVNLTIESMDKLCSAVGKELRIQIEPSDYVVNEGHANTESVVIEFAKYAKPQFGVAIQLTRMNSTAVLQNMNFGFENAA
jgi:transcriptional regulator with XRE-family HTH domain